MAEVLAIAASGATFFQLAGQAAGNINKLKCYWDQVKEAPDNLKLLVEEIDSLNIILCHMQSEQTNDVLLGSRCGNTAEIVSKSLELCQKGADELSRIVDDLAKKIDGKVGWKKKLSSTKIVLKNSEVRGLKERMQYAIRLLTLAYQCHTNAMIRLQPDIIVARLSSTESFTSVITVSEGGNYESQAPSEVKKQQINSDNLCSQDVVTRQCLYWSSTSSWAVFLLGSLIYRKRQLKDNKTGDLEIRTKYTLPAWLSRRALDLRVYSLGGWQANLRTYRTLPPSHEFFTYAIKGDVDALRNMMLTRQALASDRDSVHGLTALHLAARQGHLEACKLLLDAGADPLACSDGNQTPLHSLTFWASRSTFRHRRPVLDVCRLLVNFGAIDTLVYDSSVIARKNMPIALLRYLQQTMYPPYHELPLRQRFEMASHIRSGGWLNVPELIRMALGSSNLNDEIVTHRDSAGRTLIHHIARGWANGDYGPAHAITTDDIDTTTWHDPLKPSSHGHPWRLLLSDSIRAGSPLHATDSHGRSPLCTLIRNTILSYSDGVLDRTNRLSRLLNVWLVELHASGVDLQQYGYCEMALGLRSKVNRLPNRASKTLYRTRLSKLLNFSYGPKPEDWQFWFTESTDAFAGLFHTMIEHSGQPTRNLEEKDSLLSIPGSWNELVFGKDEDEDEDMNSDCESEIDDDSNYGDDPDYDVQRLCRAEKTKTFYIRVPTTMPLTPESNLLLFNRGGAAPFQGTSHTRRDLHLPEFD